MAKHPSPRPEGVLIKTALEAMKPKLSVRKAAPLAGIGEARWRQIVNGYQTVSGTHVEVRAPDDTLARMAMVVGVTPEQLEGVNRAEAADELRALRRERAREHAPPKPLREIDPWSLSEDEFRRLSAEQQMAVLARMMEVARESGGEPGDSGEPQRPTG
jgi:hypothetical protein